MAAGQNANHISLINHLNNRFKSVKSLPSALEVQLLHAPLDGRHETFTLRCARIKLR